MVQSGDLNGAARRVVSVLSFLLCLLLQTTIGTSLFFVQCHHLFHFYFHFFTTINTCTYLDLFCFFYRQVYFFLTLARVADKSGDLTLIRLLDPAVYSLALDAVTALPLTSGTSLVIIIACRMMMEADTADRTSGYVPPLLRALLSKDDRFFDFFRKSEISTHLQEFAARALLLDKEGNEEVRRAMREGGIGLRIVSALVGNQFHINLLRKDLVSADTEDRVSKDKLHKNPPVHALSNLPSSRPFPSSFPFSFFFKLVRFRTRGGRAPSGRSISQKPNTYFGLKLQHPIATMLLNKKKNTLTGARSGVLKATRRATRGLRQQKGAEDL
jgi:hypothetical protein